MYVSVHLYSRTYLSIGPSCPSVVSTSLIRWSCFEDSVGVSGSPGCGLTGLTLL